MIRRLLSLPLALLAYISPWTNADRVVAEPSAQRIIFFGDSLTQEATGQHGFVSLTRSALAAAHQGQIELIASGVRGNTVHDLAARLERDVLAFHPTVVVILIGINDIARLPRGTGTQLEPFIFQLQQIINKLTSRQSQVLLCTPPVIGEDKQNEFTELLNSYQSAILKLQTQPRVTVVDLRKAFLDYLSQENSGNKSRGVLTRDGVHLNAAGNQLVARVLLPQLELIMQDSAESAYIQKGVSALSSTAP